MSGDTVKGVSAFALLKLYFDIRRCDHIVLDEAGEPLLEPRLVELVEVIAPAREIVVEQLYRAMTIMRGEPYHHE